ncbi:response regulator [Parvularcula sp. LCG005]|uniref:response regulator n=1 Tax=Parvularcula sp. LCG005 TaxID=3078805 RepID=UPI0029428A46|nr:response regulator [Parvularcula sp. LCG005]WOI54706.1 response regulator [Parvularcula sp. LCG005]
MVAKSLNVLVVDDSDADAFTISACLDSCPDVADYMRARDGQEALEILLTSQFKPDLILLDLNMPRIDGFGFIHHYEENSSRSCKIAILSTSGSGTDYHRAVLRNAKTYIVKPPRMSQLRRTLNELCRSVRTNTPIPQRFFCAA